MRIDRQNPVHLLLLPPIANDESGRVGLAFTFESVHIR